MIDFDDKETKIWSREAIVEVYRGHSKKSGLSPERQFWSLCSTQSHKKTSEINQLVALKLINKEQYYGVDWDGRKIKGNKKRHPQAHWLAGDWEEVLLEYPELFNPEIVFLDFTSLAGTEKILSATRRTLRDCPANTYLFINVMLNNPRDPRIKWEIDTFIDELGKYIADHDFEGWRFLSCKDFNDDAEKSTNDIACYQYTCTKKTNMCMYSLWKDNL